MFGLLVLKAVISYVNKEKHRWDGNFAVSRCRHGHMMVSSLRPSEQKVDVPSSERRETGTTVTVGPVRAHRSLRSAHLYRYSSGAKVAADAASGEKGKSETKQNWGLKQPHFFAHVVTFKGQSLFNRRQLHISQVCIYLLNIAKYICCIGTGYQVIMVPCDSDIATSLEEKNNI